MGYRKLSARPRHHAQAPGTIEAVVALAAKLARIVWAVLRHGRAFEHQAHAVS
jgi:hypothetical protein